MRKVLEPTAAMFGVLLMSLEPASALPSANGSFGYVPNNLVVANGPTPNNGQLGPNTTSIDYPYGGTVNIAGTGTLNIIQSGDYVYPMSFQYPTGGEGPVSMSLLVDGMSWQFNYAHEIFVTNNFASWYFYGVFEGGGGLEPGASAILSQSCDQIDHGIINCSNTEVTTGVREPASLALLGAGLLSLGLIYRRKQKI